MVCGIRDPKGGIWDHRLEIRDHKPWDRDQQVFGDQRSGCTIFVGSECCHMFGTKDQKFGYKNGISDERKKHTSYYDPVLCDDFRTRNFHRSSHSDKVLPYIVNIKCVRPRRLFRNLRLKSKYFVNHLATTLFIEDEFSIVKKSLASIFKYQECYVAKQCLTVTSGDFVERSTIR